MTNEPPWRREGRQLVEIRCTHYIKPRKSWSTRYVHHKDERTIWEKIKDWYASSFKNEPRIIYIDPAKFKIGTYVNCS